MDRPDGSGRQLAVALLDVRDLKTSFRPTTASSAPSTASRSRSRRARRSAIVGESGCGKSVTCLTIMGLNPQAQRRSSTGEAIFKGRDLLELPASRAAQGARRRDLDDLPGSDDVAEPGAHGRQAARRGDPAARRRRPRRRRKPRARRDAEGGRHPPRRAAARRLPAPVLGRHAPAGDDRDGADQQPRPAHRRRADDGARRHDAGPDPEADERPAARLRQRDHHDHARPRRRRRDRRRRARDVRGQVAEQGTYADIFYQPSHPYTWGLLGRCRGSPQAPGG